jgi:hypothetical protein
MSNNFDMSSTGVNVELNLFSNADCRYDYFNDNVIQNSSPTLFVFEPEHAFQGEGKLYKTYFEYSDLLDASLYDFSDTCFDKVLQDMHEKGYITEEVKYLLISYHQRNVFKDSNELLDTIIEHLKENDDDEAYKVLQDNAKAHYVFTNIRDDDHYINLMYFSKESLEKYRENTGVKIECNEKLAETIVKELEHSFNHTMLNGQVRVSNKDTSFEVEVYYFYYKEMPIIETEIDKEDFMKAFAEYYQRDSDLHVFDKQTLLEELGKLVPKEIDHWN